MSIERLLDQIRVRFDTQTARAVVSAFRAEPLAWHYLENTPDLEQWLSFASDDLSRWQPVMLALFSLDQTLPEQDLTNLEINLPAELHERITNVFEMTRLTGLEPTSLPDAALLALHLREFRRKEGSWDAISENLLTGKCRLAVWKTAFAILPQLVPDFDAAMDSLVAELSPQHAETLGSLIVHQVVINPADENIRYQTYRRRLFGGNSRSLFEDLNGFIVFACGNQGVAEQNQGFTIKRVLFQESLRDWNRFLSLGGFNGDFSKVEQVRA